MMSNELQFPQWIRRCFPGSGGSNRTADRFRRLGAHEFDAKGSAAGWVDVSLEFPGLDGKPETGEGRIFLPARLRTDSGPLPLIHNAGYELDPAGAAGWLKQGYVVSTIRNHPLNPLGRGYLLDAAFLNAARALPFVDPGAVGVNGGSAGGWMTLMLASSTFPLIWAMPDVPPLHWNYNADFIARNKERSGRLGSDGKPVLPFTHAVSAITDQDRSVFGTDFLSPEWLSYSPLAQLDTITGPVMAIFTTADMLVPINQVGREFVRPIDPKRFPEGFSFEYDPRTPRIDGKWTLTQLLNRRNREIFVISSVASQTRLTIDLRSNGPARRIEMPFSKSKQWSVVILDEGAPEPTVGHLKYVWDQNREPFRRHWESVGLRPDQLTSVKLMQLMHRYAGRAWRPMRIQPGGTGSIRSANTLDWPEAEKYDVLLGLEAFVADDQRADRFVEVYSGLPRKWQLFDFGTAAPSPAAVRRYFSEARRRGGA